MASARLTGDKLREDEPTKPQTQATHLSARHMALAFDAFKWPLWRLAIRPPHLAGLSDGNYRFCASPCCSRPASQRTVLILAPVGQRIEDGVVAPALLS